jgi:hypothetical protein
VAAAVALGVLVGVVAGGGGDDKGGAPPRQVRLEPISSNTPNPFMPPAGTDQDSVEPPTDIATSPEPQTYQGSLPGLYGGTRDTASCDPDQMVSFLQSNPDKATAWANALGISRGDIPTYVADLTPLILRADTAVTNHGFVNGRANAIPAILQAGTAVLVDKYGVPRVKCYCGNPLTPASYPADPIYNGPPWPTFKPGAVVIIDQSTTVINVITVIDINTNEPFGRPVGTSGGDDGEAPVVDTPTPPDSGDQPIGGSSDDAVAAVRTEVKSCFDQIIEQGSNDPDAFLSPEDLRQIVDSLQYTVASGENGAFVVAVTGPEGDLAKWTVDSDGGITPADPTAAEIGAQCPGLA